MKYLRFKCEMLVQVDDGTMDAVVSRMANPSEIVEQLSMCEEAQATCEEVPAMEAELLILEGEPVQDWSNQTPDMWADPDE